MKSKNILVDLIEHLSNYEADCSKLGVELNMTDFIGYLNSTFSPDSVKVQQLQGDVKPPEFTDNSGSDTDISILIVLLFRYAKGYIKKALKDSLIHTADEFSFLITLMTYDSLSKTELIQKQVMEKTSGTEIINRLLRQGLIDQFNDQNDKRSIRVQITAAGRMELIKILPHMQAVSQIVSGNLNETEKLTLAFMLRKLEHFHNDIFIHKKDYDLAQLLN